ncbi:MAG: type II secretion system F family protein [Planctomycetes bacterium]|nr:type II secretion system F family protein [Planctomycetota bacterium]
MVYPLFLLCVSVIVVGVLTTFVVPKFIEMFVNSNQELPLPTKLLDMGMTFVKDSWWVVLIGLAGLTGLVMIALREKRLRLSLDHTLMRMPLFGQVNQKLQIARFARTLGSLMRGGVRIVEAINTTRGVTSNLAFERGVSNIETQLLKGSTLAKAIEEQPYFSEITSNMVAVGEETGMLPEMLLEVADMYDQECESAINSVTTLLGPIMIVVLGAIVGFVVVAILLPIFRTSTMIG